MIARKKSKSALHLKMVAGLQAWHRTMYMGERKVYYQQRWQAIRSPDEYMSIIMDGMSANHTVLPWFADKSQFGAPYFQHLQGVLAHGCELVIARTFENIKDDSNLAIHCLLMILERRMLTHHRLPNTIYLRVDGGSENANKYLLAMCELLVHCKLTKQIILTRLPVGHTHEDIDGKFGNIWQWIKSRCVETPQEYKAAIETALNKQGSLPVTVTDIFVVPDYKAFLETAMHKDVIKG